MLARDASRAIVSYELTFGSAEFLLHKGFLVGNALPFSVALDPGVSESSVMDERFAIICALRAVSTGHDSRIAIKIDRRAGIGNLLGIERFVLHVGQILRPILQGPVVIDADESIRQNGGGSVGIVMDLGLVPCAFQGQNETLVAGRIVCLLCDCSGEEGEY